MAIVRVSVRVKPGTTRARVGGAYGDPPQLVVAVNAPPVDGAANEAVLRAVATAVGLRPRNVRLLSGQTSRSKVLELEVPDDEQATVSAALMELLKAGP